MRIRAFPGRLAQAQGFCTRFLEYQAGKLNPDAEKEFLKKALNDCITKPDLRVRAGALVESKINFQRRILLVPLRMRHEKRMQCQYCIWERGMDGWPSGAQVLLANRFLFPDFARARPAGRALPYHR